MTTRKNIRGKRCGCGCGCGCCYVGGGNGNENGNGNGNGKFGAITALYHCTNINSLPLIFKSGYLYNTRTRMYMDELKNITGEGNIGRVIRF